MRGVVFFSVPHRGSDIAALGKMLARGLKIATLGFGINPRYVKALDKNSKDLDNISRQFVERLETIQVRTFYETEKAKGQLVCDLQAFIYHILILFNFSGRRRGLCPVEYTSGTRGAPPRG